MLEEDIRGGGLDACFSTPESLAVCPAARGHACVLLTLNAVGALPSGARRCGEGLHTP